MKPKNILKVASLLAVVGGLFLAALPSQGQNMGQLPTSFTTVSNVMTYVDNTNGVHVVTNSTSGLTNIIWNATTYYSSNLFNAWLWSDTYHTNAAFGPNTNGGLIPLAGDRKRYVTIQVSGIAPAGTLSNTLTFAHSAYLLPLPNQVETTGSTTWTFNSSAAGTFNAVKSFEYDADGAWWLTSWVTGTNAANFTNPVVLFRTQ